MENNISTSTEVEDYILPDRDSVICNKCSGVMRYKSSGNYICEDCGNEFLNDYAKVRSFLEKRGNSTISEISVATGVSWNKVNQLVSDGRIMLSADSKGAIKCEICGMPIRYGVRCERCSHLTVDLEHIDHDIKAKRVYREVNRSRNLRSYDNQSGMRFIKSGGHL